jgi:protein-L-isoaspartate O-methyltransferase
MFTDKLEEDFFLSHLKNHHKVLEYGSGESTLQIANLVNKIVSVEHQQLWFDSIKNKSQENCKILFAQPDLPYTEGKHCGTYDEFSTYINSPTQYGPYDIILIDGRARIECSKICNKLSHQDTIIFVHDWHREEYHEICKYLHLIEVKNTMAKFRL